MEKMPFIKIRIAHTDKYTLVDGDYDGEYFSQFTWRLTNHGHVSRPERINGVTKFVYLHREVTGTPPEGLEVDHVDGNPLNNRSYNLRWVTHSENCLNRRQAIRKNKTGYRGVRKNPGSKGYTATLRGKYLGWAFDNAIEAALAYDKAAKERYGDRAVLNFP